MKFTPGAVREVRAVFGPTGDDGRVLTPVRASVMLAGEDDTEVTVEVTGVMDEPPSGGIDTSRETIEANTFDSGAYSQYIAGRMSGLLSLSIRLTHDGLAGFDGLRITHRPRGGGVPRIVDVLPNVPAEIAVDMLLRDRDFLGRQLRTAEDNLETARQVKANTDRAFAAERAALHAELRDALTARDEWRKRAKARRRKLNEARAQLAEISALPEVMDGYNLNARDAHDDPET